MNPTKWNSIAAEYSSIREATRILVFKHVHELIRIRQTRRLLDYGGGDGTFATICADIPALEIVSFDHSPNMVALARKNCQGFPQIAVVDSTVGLGSGVFDAISLHAVWMCLPTARECAKVLADVRRLLAPGGIIYASVTHPCFRTERFSSYHTDFNMRDYLKDGTHFGVTIVDGDRELKIVDTHWSLGAMVKQLAQVGLAVSDITELPDLPQGEGMGSPWMIVTARLC